MASRFAFVFNKDLQQGLAYMWFNIQADRLGLYAGEVISCVQATHQQATEKRLLNLVKGSYPDATIWEDPEGSRFRYIKTK